MSNYPFQNLVFRGGGVLGIAYLGALKVLDSDQYNIYKQIKRVSGASVGAITALAVSLCSTADEVRAMANSLDFSKVPEKENEDHNKEIEKLLEKMFGKNAGDIDCIKRLLSKYGWYSSNYFYGWLQTSINSKFANASFELKNKNGLQTFSDFKKAGFRDLYVSVTNVTKHCNEIFSFESTPDMPVADAVRMSMSIPLFFESIEYNGCHYADGGTVNNYPMEIFDQEKYMNNKGNFIKDINWETLGCHLFTPAGQPAPKKDNIIHYIEDVFLTLLQTQTIEFYKTPNLQQRSADISDLGIRAVDFNIQVDNGDPFRTPLPDTPYDNLYRSGYNAMQEYLKGYYSNSPVARPQLAEYN